MNLEVVKTSNNQNIPRWPPAVHSLNPSMDIIQGYHIMHSQYYICISEYLMRSWYLRDGIQRKWLFKIQISALGAAILIAFPVVGRRTEGRLVLNNAYPCTMEFN